MYGAGGLGRGGGQQVEASGAASFSKRVDGAAGGGCLASSGVAREIAGVLVRSVIHSRPRAPLVGRAIVHVVKVCV